MHPIFLEARIESRVWGGAQLKTEFARTLNGEPIGESWEIHGGLKVIGTDLTLDELLEANGPEFLGERQHRAERFPLLTKWLDCRAWLSVQVHPDDALAQRFTGDPTARGKAEAWYVHKALPDAELIHGLADGVTGNQLAAANGDEILELLKRVRPYPGQLLYTPAGMIHALGPGNFIYEVQQSCDLTYRFYDWGRSREIHLERAALCVQEAKPTQSVVTEHGIECPFFSIRIDCGPREWTVGKETFEILVMTAAGFTLQWGSGLAKLAAGQSILLPAGLGPMRLTGPADAPHLHIWVPPKERR